MPPAQGPRGAAICIAHCFAHPRGAGLEINAPESQREVASCIVSANETSSELECAQCARHDWST